MANLACKLQALEKFQFHMLTRNLKQLKMPSTLSERSSSYKHTYLFSLLLLLQCASHCKSFPFAKTGEIEERMGGERPSSHFFPAVSCQFSSVLMLCCSSFHFPQYQLAAIYLTCQLLFTICHDSNTAGYNPAHV